MKKILLLNTPFYRLMGGHYNEDILGIEYIAACLNGHGHETKIYNSDYLDIKEYPDQRRIFEGYTSYKEIMKNPDHPIWEEIVTNILSYSPNILGITLYTANIKAARIIARKVKELDKDAKIVAGRSVLSGPGTASSDSDRGSDLAMHASRRYRGLKISRLTQRCVSQGMTN